MNCGLTVTLLDDAAAIEAAAHADLIRWWVPICSPTAA